MRRLVVFLAAVLGLLAATALQAGAITGNHVKDNENPFVGLVTFYGENGGYSHRCSGSLLTPTVFLTAGHCTDGSATTARVYVQQDAGFNYDPGAGADARTGYPKRCAEGTLGKTCASASKLYDYASTGSAAFSDTRDAGLVVLDQPIALPEYGALAAPGSLDKLAARRGQQEVTFTISGYGLSLASPTQTLDSRERLMAKTKLLNLRGALTDGYNVQLSSNPGDGRGGACFGDSGGPVFYGGFGSNTIVGVTSFGINQNCRGAFFAYRSDTQDVNEWILKNVPQSEADKIRIVKP